MDSGNKMNIGGQLAADGGEPEAAQLIDDMLGQLLIVLVKRQGGVVRIPVLEIDNTGQDLLMMKVEGTDFIFETKKKS